MTSLTLCKFFHVWANALIVNPCTKFRCDKFTNKEDNPPPKPKHQKKPSPIRVNVLLHYQEDPPVLFPEYLNNAWSIFNEIVAISRPLKDTGENSFKFSESSQVFGEEGFKCRVHLKN